MDYFYDNQQFLFEEVRKEPPLRQQTCLLLYKNMLKTRMLEDTLLELQHSGQTDRPTHLSHGQEALSVGFTSALEQDDLLFHSHRGHGQYLTKGGDMKKFFAELFCKDTASTRGLGGMFHLTQPDVGLMGGQGILGDVFALATGMALGIKMDKKHNVSVAVFGDGSAEEGPFYESMNFATMKQLPLLYICENNFYSMASPQKNRTILDVYKRSFLFMPSYLVDGTEVEDCYFKTKEVLGYIRSGRGPALIEMRAYRFSGHMDKDDTDDMFRTNAERNSWLKHDPVLKYENTLRAREMLTDRQRTIIVQEIQEELDDAIAFAKRSPYPSDELLEQYVYCE